MTVEERAWEIVNLHIGPGMDYGEVEVAIVQALRDQIEECAKIADKIAEEINDWHWPDRVRYEPSKAEVADLVAEQIRSLAAPASETKEKGD